MTTTIKKKIDQFKSMQSPSGNEPTRQEAVDSAIDTAVKLAMEAATSTFSPVIKSLANELAEANNWQPLKKSTSTPWTISCNQNKTPSPPYLLAFTSLLTFGINMP